ncbi:P-loop NTPase family protein [Faecalibacter bovis]|uniref:Adenylate kinase n=1 Tax=Faecalibacter bovis TaxID=2898187 RepID=A0ABX7XD62_9FLAO|nr:adenylate kinase [Faecalibacter bovis]QTV05830.1 adenylate kinase [Faecalibacter bovis]
MEPLENLGKRICIIGLSAGGKSTLAQALSKKLKIKVFHLDQIAHIPFTNWKEQDPEIFTVKHQQILLNNQEWIIEGNYNRLMQERFSQATTIIWLDFSKWGSVFRYIKRTLKNNPYRPGKLEGSEDLINFDHIHYTLFTAPKNREIYKKLTEESNAKIIRLNSFKELKKIYKHWEL